MSFTSKQSYDMWIQMIYDEELASAVLEGRYRDLRDRDFSLEQLEILDWFHRFPGTRWSLENLRFRTTLETAAVLQIYLPRTVGLLTRSQEDWLSDITYEYLSLNRWHALGHMRLTECQRFADFVRERVVIRRAMHSNFEPVLELELAAIAVQKQTAEVPADRWITPPRLPSSEVAACRPRSGPAQRIVEQPVDVRAVMKADPADIESLENRPGPGPVSWLISVPTLHVGLKMKVISGGVREVIERCTGERAAVDIAAELEQEFDLASDAVLELIGSLVAEGTLVPT